MPLNREKVKSELQGLSSEDRKTFFDCLIETDPEIMPKNQEVTLEKIKEIVTEVFQAKSKKSRSKIDSFFDSLMEG